MNPPDLVLVTRTGSAGRRLLETLLAAGWPARDGCPLRLTGPENPEQLIADFSRLRPFDRIVLTSSEAVRQAVGLLGAEALSGCPVIVPGPGTRDTATSLGLQQVSSPTLAGNSEAMLALPELADVAGLHVLIMAAPGGRQLLASELGAKGACVSCLHVYRRLSRPLPKDTLDALARAQSPLTLLASAGALHGLRRQLAPDLWQHLLAGVMVAPSPRVAAMAAELGCSQVATARGANDQALIRTLLACTNDGQLL